LIARTLIAVVVATMFVGCSSDKVVRAPLEVTIGQQLIDLKKARDNGVLSASEYDSQRKKLIDSVE
jgi:hypothetical protein